MGLILNVIKNHMVLVVVGSLMIIRDIVFFGDTIRVKPFLGPRVRPKLLLIGYELIFLKCKETS